MAEVGLLPFARQLDALIALHREAPAALLIALLPTPSRFRSQRQLWA